MNETKFIYQDSCYKILAAGEHQVRNAILAIEIMKHLKIPAKAILSGLNSSKQPLCLEKVSEQPVIILDGAHNPDKIKTTVNAMKSLKLKDENTKIHLIVGFSENKDINKMVKLLSKLKPETIACTRNTINHFRKVANPKLIVDMFKKYLVKTKYFISLDPIKALNWSKKQTKTGDLILATGSIFLSGELRKKFN